MLKDSIHNQGLGSQNLPGFFGNLHDTPHVAVLIPKQSSSNSNA